MSLSVILFPVTVAFAAFVILVTFASMVAALLTYLLFRVQGQHVLFISLLTLAVAAMQLFTLIQQFLQMASWPSLAISIFEREQRIWKTGVASIAYDTYPSLAIKIIFGIRMYLFNAGSLIFLFWNISLAVSVWGLSKSPMRFSVGAKVAAFVLPAVQTIVVYIPAIQANAVVHIVLYNLIIAPNLVLGSILLVITVCRSATRAKIQSPTLSRASPTGRRAPLLFRFTIGFVILAIVQASFIIVQVLYARNIVRLREQRGSQSLQPGWTLSEQIQDWALYLPTSSMGLMLYFVFGTTREVSSGWSKIRDWLKSDGGDARELGLEEGKGKFLDSPSTPSTAFTAFSPPRTASSERAGLTQHVELPALASPYGSPLDDYSIASSQNLITISRPRIISWTAVSEHLEPDLPRPSPAFRMESGRYSPGSRGSSLRSHA